MNVLPVWLAIAAFAALMVWALAPMATGATTIPLCHEDEVITLEGECVPLDDATYEREIGWVAQ